MENDLIVELAKKYGASSGQIVLSWGVQRGTSVVPKSESEERLRKNITVSLVYVPTEGLATELAACQIVKLDAGDMKAIDELHTRPDLHRSLLGSPPGRIKGVVFGWTYDQLGWNMDEDGIVKI